MTEQTATYRFVRASEIASMPKIYYMRDNHQFMAVPCDPGAAEDILRQEFDEGYTHGTLFSREDPGGFVLHAHGYEHLEEFIQEARNLIEYLKRTSKANEH